MILIAFAGAFNFADKKEMKPQMNTDEHKIIFDLSEFICVNLWFHSFILIFNYSRLLFSSKLRQMY